MSTEKYLFKISNFFDIYINTLESGMFAFYLYNKDKLIAKSKYVNNSNYVFKNNPPGNYRVKVFKKLNDSVETMISKPLLIRNISQTNFSVSNYILDQPNYDLSWIYYLLKDAVNFTAYIGDENSTDTYMGLSPVSHNKVDNNTRILTCDFSHRFNDKYEFISLSHSSDNLLNELLSRKSMVDLYYLSRKIYLLGFEKGAHYIWMYMRKNSGCSLSYKTIIGDNFKLGLGGIGTIIHPNTIIGSNVKIAQHVTVGLSRGSSSVHPIIGDNVYIAPGAICLGGKIGSNVLIGAGAVVLDEVPDNCVVAGVPAKIISTDITKYSQISNLS